MARWAIHWESTPDNGRPKWRMVLRTVIGLVLLVVLVSAIAALVVTALVRALS